MGPHIHFRISNSNALAALEAFIARVAEGKKTNSFPPDDELIGFFDEEALSYFFEPSPAELKEWETEWFSTPLEQRHGNPALEPRWSFGSMVEAFANGDYELTGVGKGGNEAFLQFNPLAYPYGGVGCMIAAIESLGHTVIGVDDGTGYRAYEKRTVYWMPKGERRVG